MKSGADPGQADTFLSVSANQSAHTHQGKELWPGFGHALIFTQMKESVAPVGKASTLQSDTSG